MVRQGAVGGAAGELGLVVAPAQPGVGGGQPRWRGGVAFVPAVALALGAVGVAPGRGVAGCGVVGVVAGAAQVLRAGRGPLAPRNAFGLAQCFVRGGGGRHQLAGNARGAGAALAMAVDEIRAAGARLGGISARGAFYSGWCAAQALFAPADPIAPRLAASAGVDRHAQGAKARRTGNDGILG